LYVLLQTICFHFLFVLNDNLYFAAQVGIVFLFYIHLLFAKKTEANTKTTKEKAGHVQITTFHGFR